MLDLLPPVLSPVEPLPSVYPARGERPARVTLLAGWVQQAIAPRINWATLRVLATNGAEVVVPDARSCCGALSAHTGAIE